MTIDEEIARLRRARQILEDAVESMSDEIAISSLTLMKDRSINEGIIINGNPNQKAKYSTRPINTQRFKGKELNRAGSKYIEANILGTWQGFRKAQGLRNEDVNLAYTNEMWESIRVIKTTRAGKGKASTEIGSLEEEQRKKIEGNAARFGDFLKPTDEELQIGQEVLQEKILKLLRQ